MKNQADNQYKDIVLEVLFKSGVMNTDEEVRTKWEDGTPAYSKSTTSQVMKFDNTEIPILTSKKVGWKTSIKELLWIWQLKSNDVRVLQKMGVTIWDEWMLDDYTIGKAYGYQLAKKNRKYPKHKIRLDLLHKDNRIHNLHYSIYHCFLDQVDYLIQELVNNPASRRHMTNIWCVDDLDKMSLTPCVYETQWHVKKGKLHLEVRCRSNDLGLGNPFNIFQYNILQRMIAQVTGYELGDYTYYIGDAHIYDRHIEPLLEQMSREIYEPPKLWINPEVTNFYDFTIDDFKLIDYKHGEPIDMEVAI